MGKRRPVGDPKIAIAYLRVSTTEQRLGPESQREAIAAFAARAGISVVAFHLDQGVSGGAELPDRPGLLAAIVDLREHNAGLLLVAKRDRLARDVVVAGLVDREIAKHGARVVSADGAGNGDAPEDLYMRGQFDLQAQYLRAVIKQRTRAALAVKRARGERVGAVPYGYRLAADGVHLEPDPAEQTAIADARELHGRGMSLRSVAAELARLGRHNRVGRPLALTSVARILSTAATV